MRPRRCAGSLALLCLILAGCGLRMVPVPVHLPEPALPGCLAEEAPKEQEAVGRYEFRAGWLASVLLLVQADRGAEATKASLECASETAKALREAVTVIRMGNRP